MKTYNGECVLSPSLMRILSPEVITDPFNLRKKKMKKTKSVATKVEVLRTCTFVLEKQYSVRARQRSKLTKPFLRTSSRVKTLSPHHEPKASINIHSNRTAELRRRCRKDSQTPRRCVQRLTSRASSSCKMKTFFSSAFFLHLSTNSYRFPTDPA
jgi:hypothetical protein